LVHADAGVGHDDRDAALGRGGAQGDQAAPLGELDGVGQKVEEDLAQLGGIAGHRQHLIQAAAFQLQPRIDALLRTIAMQSFSTSDMSSWRVFRAILPASLLDRSSTSLITARRWRPLRRMSWE